MFLLFRQYLHGGQEEFFRQENLFCITLNTIFAKTTFKDFAYEKAFTYYYASLALHIAQCAGSKEVSD